MDCFDGNFVENLSFVHLIGEKLTNTVAYTRRRESPANRQLSSTRQKKHQPVKVMNSISWDKFKDGWPNLFINNVQDIAGQDVIFLGNFESPEMVFEQLSILYCMPRYLVRSFKFILPYFPTGTMERVDTEGQVATAKTLATLLSAIPSTARGPAQVVIFDIHALQERFYFSDEVIPRLETAIPLLLKEMLSLPAEMKFNLSIAFPDEGAYKRFHNCFVEFPTIICTKVRENDKRIVTVKEGDPEAKHVIIVDDLVQSGETLQNCGKVLLAKKAASVSAFVTHPVFPQNSWKKFATENLKKDDPSFRYFWITDSIPHAAEIARYPPFNLLSLCDVISDALLGYDLLQ